MMTHRKQNRQPGFDVKKLIIYCMVGSGVTCFLVVLLFPDTIKFSLQKHTRTFRIFTSDKTNDAFVKPHNHTDALKAVLLNLNLSNLVLPASSKLLSPGKITNKNTSSAESGFKNPDIDVQTNKSITLTESMDQKVKPSGNTTMTIAISQMTNISNWHGDVMPTQPPPSGIVPSKSANYSVCAILMGGLGNQMFQFATVYGLSAKKGMSVSIDKTNFLTKIFNFTVDKKENHLNRCKTFVGRSERLNCGYDGKMASFPPDNNYRVGAYLQSWMYFYNASVSLRKQFVFQNAITAIKNKVIDSVLKKYNFTSRSNVTLIGVHIRRGDLVNHKFGYMVASESYLQKSINYFQLKGFKNVIYIICSNDMKWSKENMPKGINSEYIEGNSPGVDMAILGSCDHMVTTVGSFSWWSAWLTGGEVTFYQWPAKEGSALRKQFSKDYRDYFHPGWVGFS